MAWEKGIKYHVLGFGLMTLYPCIAFFCGDDPCQHRISGLQEGNSRHGCVYCLYPTLTGAVYDPTIHLDRNASELKRLCSIAEEVFSIDNDINIRNLSVAHKEAINLLQLQNVHAHSNPFHFAPMGANNNIYKGNPPDLLHMFCAGLMKGMVQWILTIILELHGKGKL